MMRKLIFVLTVGLMLAACSGERVSYVFPAPAADEPEAQIHFIQYKGIYSWHADTDTVLYVESSARQWYRVDLLAPCTGLPFAMGVRLLPSDGAGTFDRFSYIAIHGQRCKVQSVKKIGPPVRNVMPPAVRPNAETRSL
jgi:Family of unknown function (DUF6491)